MRGWCWDLQAFRGVCHRNGETWTCPNPPFNRSHHQSLPYMRYVSMDRILMLLDHSQKSYTLLHTSALLSAAKLDLEKSRADIIREGSPSRVPEKKESEATSRKFAWIRSSRLSLANAGGSPKVLIRCRSPATSPSHLRHQTSFSRFRLLHV